MKQFDVLDRHLNIHRNYLLEASAGTGKTFSIENIVVRLLIEGENPPGLEEILVVTFTRAATRDLKVRIRDNIEKTTEILSQILGGSPPEGAPDFLQAYLGGQIRDIQRAIRRLNNALFCFDQAQIFTIHGFCSKMLAEHVFEGGVGLDATVGDEGVPYDVILRVIRDFFRTEIHERAYSKGQLKGVLKLFGLSFERLEQTIYHLIVQGLPFEYLPSLDEQLFQLNQVMADLPYTSEKILEDFHLQAPGYRGLCDRSRQIKPEILVAVKQFAALFDKDLWGVEDLDVLVEDQLFLVKAFDPNKRNSKELSLEGLHFPDMLRDLKEKLTPLISPHVVLARMAAACQKMLQRYLDEEEKLNFDDLLKKMLKAIDHAKFVHSIRQSYRAAIIDEFQDTDPIQWEIFCRLFPPKDMEWGSLYLVGDPKQSIYAFRQADIYTYLKAADALGSDHHATLDTNYRSQASLVEGLNTLFATRSSPGLISLPRERKVLPYHPVKATERVPEKKFSDSLGSVHFAMATGKKSRTFPLEDLEKQAYLPFIAQEITRLHRHDGVPFEEFAILVADRFQAQRVATRMLRWGIPTVTQRSTSLADSPAVSSLRELIMGLLSPRHESSLKTALGGRIIGWNNEQVLDFSHADILLKFYHLQKILYEGFAPFFQHFMQTSWHEDGRTVIERLLAQESGLGFYQDLNQLAELLYEEERLHRAGPEAILSFLDDLPKLAANDDDRIKRRLDPSSKAVQVMTLHSSKGLEFGVVFPLGLVKRSKAPSQLIPDGSHITVAPDKESERYLRYAEELDAEKMRQLYVAMTRAKYRLYVPVARFPEGIPVEIGCASPMELFLARLGQPETSYSKLYSRIQENDGSNLCELIDQEENLSGCELNEMSFDISEVENNESVDLVKPKPVTVPGKILWMNSFTSLAKQSSHQLEAPHQFDVTDKSAHTLPSGSKTGTLLHEILEHLPFSIDRQELHSFIHSYVADTPFSGWEEVIASMIYQATRTPLDGSFCLADMDPKRCYRETEFLYPCDQGFLKGVIDLIFEHQGKYYLLDWKSNWLGPSTEHYHAENLDKSMREHDYFLQASLYQEALKRYLALVMERPFEEIFGGVYYVFLRGLDETQPFGIWRQSL